MAFPCFIVLSLGGPSSLCQSLPAGFGAFHLGPNQSPGITRLPGMWGVVGPLNWRWIGDVRILLKLFVHGFEMVKISCCVFFGIVFSCWTCQTYWPSLTHAWYAKSLRQDVKFFQACTLGPVGQRQGDWVCDWWSKTCTDLSKVRPVLEVTKPPGFGCPSRLTTSCPTWSSNHSLDEYGSGFG